MKAESAIIQSVVDFEMREVNALEVDIVNGDDATDAKLWEQAERIAQQLPPHGRHTQSEIAAQWLNVRESRRQGVDVFYSQQHVSYVIAVLHKYTCEPRPLFRDAYNEIANASKKPHVAQNSGNNEWYTPKEYIEAARSVLGRIDLDPASSSEANKIVKAARHYTIKDDGLTQPWRGRIWLNPPYAQPFVERFADKLAESVVTKQVSAAIVLVNNATETDWFRTMADLASAVCFPDGRVRFWGPEGESGAPLQGQAVLCIGADSERFAQAFSPFGVVWTRGDADDDDP